LENSGKRYLMVLSAVMRLKDMLQSIYFD
jgi:hypothetical protein